MAILRNQLSHSTLICMKSVICLSIPGKTCATSTYYASGNLHAVFAHIRAIGASIVCSVMEDAWLEAEWFDSDSVIRQVSRM